jgi:hypothetical protein
VLPRDDVIKSISQNDKYAAMLSEDGLIYLTGKCGPVHSTIKNYSEFEEFSKNREDISEKLVRLETTNFNMALLTEKGQIWLIGSSLGFQVTDKDDAPSWTNKELPEDEICVDISLG